MGSLVCMYWLCIAHCVYVCVVNTATTTLFLTNTLYVPFTVYYCAIENYFTSVARVFISLLVLLSYPLQIHPARRCVLTVIAQCKEWSCSKSISSKYPAKVAAGVAEASPRLRSAGPAAAVVYSSLAAGTPATSLLAARSCSPRSLPLLNSSGGGSSGKLTGGSSKSSHSSTSNSSSVKTPKLLSPDEELEQTTCAGAGHCSTTTATTTILGCSSSRSEDFLFMVVTVSIFCIVFI